MGDGCYGYYGWYCVGVLWLFVMYYCLYIWFTNKLHDIVLLNNVFLGFK